MQEELSALNLIVSAYLDFAELQAQGRRAMYMKDWITKLDSFLRLSERDVLTHAGKVSHDEAMKKVELEYERFRSKQDELPQSVDRDFERAVDEIKQISSEIPKKAATLAEKLPPQRKK